MKTSKPHLYLDFDGTISQVDVIDALLARFADSRWLEVEEQWVNGSIGSRECLEKQFSYLRASHAELYEFIDTLEIDTGFLSIVEICHEHRIPVTIISDGFEEYIRRMLKPSSEKLPLIRDVKIFANSLIELRSDEWRTVYPYLGETCKDGCATCKPELINRLSPLGASTVFVGDGLSDRFAAKAAGTVFAKSKLAEYCRDNSIAHIPFRDLSEASYTLAQMFGSEEVDQVFPSVAWSESV